MTLFCLIGGVLDQSQFQSGHVVQACHPVVNPDHCVGEGSTLFQTQNHQPVGTVIGIRHRITEFYFFKRSKPKPFSSFSAICLDALPRSSSKYSLNFTP